MIRALTLGFLAVAISGCGPADAPDTGSQRGQSFLRCAEPLDDGREETFSLPPLVIQRSGYDVAIREIKRSLVVLGLLAGISQPIKATLENLDFFLEQFKGAGVQAILVAGGVGTLSTEVVPILDRLATAPVPILLVPGASENFDVFRRAIRQKRKTSPQLLDMTRVRRVRIGNHTIVSLPGYYRPYYLTAGERGCAYDIDDIEKTASLFEKGRINVVLSPTPPRGQGERAVDRSRVGVNIGCPDLPHMLKASGVRFGLFGYAVESGGHATLDDGETAVAPGVWRDGLFVQAGASEAVPITLVGQGRSVGMAQIVELSGARARYRTILAQAGKH
ncbi:MAG: hypothetical protein QNJ97_00345 [Myxococcota bacterium]|nr:hypothetical protein [Myxococcota bacterium]